MSFWIPFLFGIGSCLASVGVYLFGHCLRLAAERDNWMKQAHALGRLLVARCNEPTEIVWRDDIPVLMPIAPVEWPEEIEVNR